MKKIIITIIITCILIFITLLYAFGIITPMLNDKIPVFLIIVVLMIFIAVLLALIFTMLNRIKEIKDGDEDDLSKY